MHYRAYFLDAANHIRHAHDMECETDAQAHERLAAMDRNGFSAELWCGTRLLATLPAHVDMAAMQRPVAAGNQCPPEPS